ncbi:IclR family transcriptional regulator [Dethiosulfatarculus sandiegensis]|uniref:IclR family transcriptional regulator n=1 Tax=Dethiosulfatarculus sandiegensis TaxID=1429043 RepID=A0A0D2G9M5_9BACT|nr:IclR family transcriptional regulator [Dethiosulfatarculus sandiegensis]KIX11532.1 hypothetical protein X474_23885 [Dethiosulfatarculus sandiegensis]
MANQSIKRAVLILKSFTYAQPSWQVSKLAKQVDLPVTTVHGLMQTLEEEGFLEQDPQTRSYSLGQMMNIMGAVQRSTLELNQKAEVPINYLAKQTGLEGRVGVFYNDAVVLTFNTGHLASTMGIAYTGPIKPTFCSAMGRAILAYMTEEEVDAHLKRVQLVSYTPKTETDPQAIRRELAKTRERGYSLELQEVALHQEAVGAPVFGPGGVPVGAICLLGEPRKISGADLEGLGQAVMNTADHISTYLGFRKLPVFR